MSLPDTSHVKPFVSQRCQLRDQPLQRRRRELESNSFKIFGTVRQFSLLLRTRPCTVESDVLAPGRASTERTRVMCQITYHPGPTGEAPVGNVKCCRCGGTRRLGTTSAPHACDVVGVAERASHPSELPKEA